MKTCTGCGETKPLNDFHLAGMGTDRRRSRCKRCFSIRRGSGELGRKFENHELFAQGLRRCSGCKEIKPLLEFSQRAASPFGVRSRCKACHSTTEGKKSSRLAENIALSKQQMRRCSKCGTVKPFSDYTPKGDYVVSRCKDCIRAEKGFKVRAHDDLIRKNRELIDQEVKFCLICRVQKPYLDFYNFKGGIGHKHPWCKVCHGRKSRVEKYGLTIEEVMAAEAVTHCEVCSIELDTGSTGTERHFDHDHDSGRFRGILCERCNVALGLLQNDVRSLQRMIDYLSRGIA